MDRGVWQAAVNGVTRVGHDLAIKPPPVGLWIKCVVLTLFRRKSHII